MKMRTGLLMKDGHKYTSLSFKSQTQILDMKTSQFLSSLLPGKWSMLTVLVLLTHVAFPQNVDRTLSIIAYNIQMLPLIISAHQKDRIHHIAPKMIAYDTVVF